MNKKKKILFISDLSNKQVNGVVTTIKNLEKELLLQNYEVYHINSDNFYSFSLPFYKEIYWATNCYKIKNHIKNIKPDYIHIVTEGPIGFFAKLYLDKKQIPYTSSYHTMFPEYLEKYFRFPKKITYNYLKWFHSKSKILLSSTKSTKQLLKEYGFKNVKEWTRGVDKNVFYPTQPKSVFYDILEHPIYGYVGRISKEKNIEDFLNLPLPGSKIVIGDGPLKEKLQKKYPKVVFTGYAFGNKLASLYCSLDAMVFPSKSDTFGLVIIEALSCGVPVIAYNVQGPKDIIEHGYNGFLANDFNELHRYTLFYNKIRRENCIISSFKYTWKNCTNIFLENLIPTNLSN